jgi:hypothetical protein
MDFNAYQRDRLVLSLALMLLAAPPGCRISDTAGRDAAAGRPAVSGEDQSSADDHAAGEASVVPVSAAATANPLQPARAFAYLKQICDLGPRVTGSRAMDAQQKLVSEHFQKLGGQVRLQRFRIRHPQTGASVPVANLIVHWHPDKTDRILLCAHYDTRPQPDNPEVPPRERGQVFLGANDGASGVALLMELAHLMPSLKSRYGVDFILVDAEEFVFPRTRQRYFVGSQYFAQDYANNRPPYRYRKAAVLDMIGDRQLQIYQDRNSIWWRDTRPVTKEIWATAKRLGVDEFIARTHPRMTQPIQDDHLMLHNVGKIPTCEIIDYDYPKFPVNRYWHTDQDTPDKCSGQSLAKVGWVMYEWLRTAE